MDSVLPEPMKPEVKMVLVGKTGAGKSASGNTILGRRAFISRPSSGTVTQECNKETAEFEGQTLAVIDTPGLFDTRKSEEELKTDIAMCISLAAPGPHVFLIVISVNRFTEEEQKSVKIIKEIFGEKAAQYTMVLFTGGDNLEADGVFVEEFISGNPNLHDFINQCPGGYHLFNNRNADERQVRELMDKITRLVERNGGSFYTNDMLKEAEKAIQEKAEELIKENPTMTAEEARRRAERDNKYITSAVMGAATGAAAVIALRAPLEAAAEDASGVLSGVAVAAMVTVSGVLLGVALRAPAEAASGVLSGVAGGAAAEAASGVLSGVAGGGAAEAASGVLSGVAGGAPAEAASGVLSGVAGGAAAEAASGVLSGVAGGAAAEAASGVLSGVAGGAPAEAASGVLSGIAGGAVAAMGTVLGVSPGVAGKAAAAAGGVLRVLPGGAAVAAGGTAVAVIAGKVNRSCTIQ